MKIKPQDAEETQSFPYYLTTLSNMLLEFEHTSLRNGSAESNPCPTGVDQDGKRSSFFSYWPTKFKIIHFSCFEFQDIIHVEETGK